tara:strand:+ start:29209 stop:29622 length:414 start_codon:yes stop_codon:yes gene_type:complete
MTSVTLNEAREAVYQRFVDNTSLAGSAYTFASESFKPAADTAWARVTVTHEAGEQDSMGKAGDRKYLRRGRLLVQLFGPVDQGLRALDLLADATRDIFEGTQFSGLYFVSADVRETGQDGEWFQLVVDAPFDYQETK